VCSCIEQGEPCTEKSVTDCSFATIAPLLGNSDGKYPRVAQCPP
jgi:hypothetical protein